MSDVGRGAGMGIGLVLGIVAAVIILPMIAMIFLCGGCALVGGAAAVTAPPPRTAPASAESRPAPTAEPAPIEPAAGVPTEPPVIAEPAAEDAMPAEPAAEPAGDAAATAEPMPPTVDPNLAAVTELTEILDDAGDPENIDAIDGLRSKLDAFAEAHPGTAAADNAKRESAALAALRIGFVWKDRGNDASAVKTFKSVAERFPGTIAARVASK